jgi:uncharacterized protein YraI
MTNSRLISVAAVAVGIAVLSGPASALTSFSTSHLNLRTGPGTQYPIVGVMNRNVPSELHGCLADYSWCSVTVAGVSGWASAEYLVMDTTGQIEHVGSDGKKLGVPVIVAEGVAAVEPVVAVGAIVGPGRATVEVVAPPAEVLSFVSTQQVASVAVTGEVVVGAVVPAVVPLYAVPESPYRFASVNGQNVVVDQNSQVVYVHR